MRGGRRIRADREVVVEIQLHRRVRLDREQHVREAAEDVRPDRLALEAAGEPGEKLLVDGDGKVVAPELRQPLEEGTVGGNGVLQTRGHFRGIDRPQKLRQALLRGVLRTVASAGGRCRLLALRLILAPQLERLGEDPRRGTQVGRREHRGRRRQLRPQPLARIAADERELTGAGTEPEAVGGDDGSNGLAHAAVSRLICP